MPIPVRCACGQAFNARDELAGRRVKCPKCGQPLAIPGQSAVAAPMPPASAYAAPPAAAGAYGQTPGFGAAAPAPFAAGQPYAPAGMMGQPSFDMNAGYGAMPQAGMMGQPDYGMNSAYGAMPQAGMGMMPNMGMPNMGMPNMGMVNMGTAGMGMPGMGMPGMGMGGFAKPARKRGSNKKLIVWSSVGGGSLLALCLVVFVVIKVVAAVNRVRATVAASGVSSRPAGSFTSSTPSSPAPVSYFNRETPVEEQQKNDALLEKFCGKLEEYANVLSSVRNAATLQANATKIEQLASEVNTMRFDVQMIDIRVTPQESQRLATKYKTRLENASRRAKQEDDRVSREAIVWQSEAIMSRFNRPDFGQPPGIPSPTAPPTPTPPRVPQPGFPR